jgi:biopolymer transport protein ExbB/TolQ
MPAWIVLLEWLGRGVLVILLGLSVWSVSIMVERRRYFTRVQSAGAFEDLKSLVRSKDGSALGEALSTDGASYLHPAAEVLKAALAVSHPSAETLDRAARSALLEQRGRMEDGLTVLATLGSNAPYIGLFGTVLGIIQAFGELSRQAGSSASVMSGISEALIATAVGLFVAIPALFSYNAFTRQIRVLVQECEIIRDLAISRMKV